MFYHDKFFPLSVIISRAGSSGNIDDGTRMITMAVLALSGFDLPGNIGESDSDFDFDSDRDSACSNEEWIVDFGPTQFEEGDGDSKDAHGERISVKKKFCSAIGATASAVAVKTSTGIGATVDVIGATASQGAAFLHRVGLPGFVQRCETIVGVPPGTTGGVFEGAACAVALGAEAVKHHCGYGYTNT